MTNNLKKRIIALLSAMMIMFLCACIVLAAAEPDEEVAAETPAWTISGNGSAYYTDNFDGHLNIAGLAGKEGLVLTLSPGAKFTYNKVIDLAGRQYSDPIAAVTVLPSAIEAFDFSNFIYTLTDANDPENFITLKFRKHIYADYPNFGASWPYVFTTSFAGGTYKDQRITFGDGSKILGEETVGVATNTVGVNVVGSFCGKTRGDGSSNTLELAMDYEERILYSHGSAVIDLDDPYIFDELFEGFTIDKAYLSIQVEDYLNTQAQFFIRNIGGFDLSADTVENDGVGPQINVDFGEYAEDDLPEGQQGVPYPIFGAKATDAYDGERVVSAAVYSNYYSSKRLVPLSEGAFMPSQPGIYTIEYSSQDAEGNVSSYPVDVNVLQNVSPITVDLGEYPEIAECGVPYVLPDPIVTGGSGNVGYTVSVTFNNDTVAASGGEFVPQEPGEYAVEYIFTDYIGNEKTVSYTVTAQASGVPVSLTDIDALLPDGFVVGAQYELPAVTARIYSADGYSDHTAVASVDNGVLSGNKYTPANEGTVNISWTVDGQPVNGKSYAVNVYSLIYDTDKVDYTKVFITEEGISVQFNTSRQLEYTFTRDAEMRFINQLLAPNFELSFILSAEACEFEEVRVNLADAVTGETFYIRLVKNGETVRAYLNEDKAMGSYALGERITVSYEETSDSVTLSGVNGGSSTTKTLKAVYNANGGNFAGFETGKVILSVEVEGVTGTASAVIESVNGHTFISGNQDKIYPAVIFRGEYGGSVSLGDISRIPEILSGDVICPTLSSVVLSVIAPNGSYVTATDGTVLNGVSVAQYEFAINQIGTYRVECEATDLFGNRRPIEYFYQLVCTDEVPPQISIAEGYKTEYSTGESFVKPEITVSDDNTAEANITVRYYLEEENGRISIMSDGYKFNAAGNYKIYVYVYDGSGEAAFVSYRITVG